MSKKNNINEDNIFTPTIITVGNSNVGKTSIIRKFCFNIFDSNTLSTIGLAFSYKEIVIKNKIKIRIKLIDTGGQEKYRAMTKSYFKNADGVLFTYSKDNQESFDEIKHWIELFNENNNREDIVKYLVETKDDLERVVDEDISREFAKKYNFGFKKTSSKKDENSVNELFQEMGEMLFENHLKYNKENLGQTGMKLTKPKKRKKVCCLFTPE